MKATLPSDTRPRLPYRLPSGDVVLVILDHDQIPSDQIGFTLKGGEIVQAELVRTPVRVRYSRGHNVNGERGWSFTVLHADSLTYLGGGWSAGTKADARSDFNAKARVRGWAAS